MWAYGQLIKRVALRTDRLIAEFALLGVLGLLRLYLGLQWTPNAWTSRDDCLWHMGQRLETVEAELTGNRVGQVSGVTGSKAHPTHEPNTTHHTTQTPSTQHHPSIGRNGEPPRVGAVRPPRAHHSQCRELLHPASARWGITMRRAKADGQDKCDEAFQELNTCIRVRIADPGRGGRRSAGGAEGGRRRRRERIEMKETGVDDRRREDGEGQQTARRMKVDKLTSRKSSSRRISCARPPNLQSTTRPTPLTISPTSTRCANPRRPACSPCHHLDTLHFDIVPSRHPAPDRPAIFNVCMYSSSFATLAFS